MARIREHRLTEPAAWEVQGLPQSLESHSIDRDSVRQSLSLVGSRLRAQPKDERIIARRVSVALTKHEAILSLRSSETVRMAAREPDARLKSSGGPWTKERMGQ